MVLLVLIAFKWRSINVQKGLKSNLILSFWLSLHFIVSLSHWVFSYFALGPYCWNHFKMGINADPPMFYISIFLVFFPLLPNKVWWLISPSLILLKISFNPKHFDAIKMFFFTTDVVSELSQLQNFEIIFIIII